ncbi:MAG: hypothetical protein CEE41_05175 [Hadesarchaea archaeon B3_Hades]|nr:MAG: hypothetical protein CEE41_05175 [Hadesarchaea archaeon B3_Hades]
MADYTAPFHLPEFTDAAFEEKKAAYVRENGYVITFPRLGDIIHVPTTPPMTSAEKVLYYSKRKGEIPNTRLIELTAQKARKKERFDRMLASPTPKIARSFASIMTAIDDCQDAFITLAMIGRIACKVLPRVLSRFLIGPVGWLWLIAELMNALMMPTACALNPRGCKRAARKRLKNAPKTMRAKMKAYPKSGRFFPSFAEGIQALQVTKDVYGWGLSLGPIVGLAMDLVSGGVRWARGEKVAFRNPPSSIEIYQKAADKVNNYARWTRPKEPMSRAAFEIWKGEKIASGTWGIKNKQHDLVSRAAKMHATYGGVLRKTDWMEEALLYTTWEIVQTGAKNCLDHWNPLEMIDGLEHIQLEAPTLEDPLSEEIFLEAGMDPNIYVAWPSLGKRWATIEEISASTAPIAAENFEYFDENCPNGSLRYIAGQSVTNGGLLALSSLEGEEALEVEHHATIAIAEMVLDHGYSFPRTITDQQIYDFGYWTAAHQEMGSRPSLPETLSYAKNVLGFEFTTKP